MAQDIRNFIATYDAHHAHPFNWRKGIKFYQRLLDKLDKNRRIHPESAETA